MRNRHTVEGKIIRLLEEFRFASMGDVIKHVMMTELSGSKD
jgi:hypothetical protein